MGTRDQIVADGIDSFFRFFDRRVQHARALCPPAGEQGPTEPDLHVLVSAGLDALSFFWAKTFSPQFVKGNGAFRMGEFLLRHGDGRIFAKCSAPHLLDRAIRNNKTLVPFIQRYLHTEGPTGTVRTWEDDPDLAQVVQDLAGLHGADAAWLQRSRYGELLYTEYRCMWLHQYQASEKLASNYSPDEPEPRYQNLSVPADAGTEIERRQLLMFSRVFMLNTYALVVAKFKQECLGSNVAPVVD